MWGEMRVCDCSQNAHGFYAGDVDFAELQARVAGVPLSIGASRRLDCIALSRFRCSVEQILQNWQAGGSKLVCKASLLMPIS